MMAKKFLPESPRWSWAGPLSLGLLVLAFYWKVLFLGKTFFFVDASRFFFPLWQWGAQALHQGLIPLWNPDAQFGSPYLADPQMACAYWPVPLVYSVLGPVNAFSALVLLHHFGALLGFWVFARHQGFSARAAFFGSFLFGFSLHVVCSSWTPVALMTLSWIPWIFRSGEMVFRRERGGLLAFSFAWAMQCAAGYPVLVYLTVLAVGLHFLWKARREGRGWGWLGSFALAGALGALYNLAWGLPFAEMMGLSNYDNGASKYHDLNWSDLGTFLNPFDQGHPFLTEYHGPHYWVSTYFIGLPALALLLWGALRKAYGKTSWTLALLFLALSLGTLGFGHLLSKILPGYSLVVHSGFWLSLVVFWLAWMAMEALELFLTWGPQGLGLWSWFALVGLLHFGAWLMAPTFAPAVFLLALGLAASAAVWKGLNARWWALMAASALSLGICAASLNRSVDRSYYEKPPEVLSALREPGRLFFTPPLMTRSTRLEGSDVMRAYEGAKQAFYPNWPLVYGREEAPFYNTLRLNEPFAWTLLPFQFSLAHSRKALDYLGIRYLFGAHHFTDLKDLAPGRQDLYLSENPTPLPRWFSAVRAIPAANSLEKDLTWGDRVKMDYGRDCFVADPARMGDYHRRVVTFSAPAPGRLELIATGNGRALIASSETAYPGWEARVNGKLRAVETVNHAFRGLLLEEGEIQASFRFQPTSFRLGLFASLLVMVLWMGLAVRRALP